MDQAEKLRQLVNLKGTKNRRFRVITVSSGKGGVGKTSFVINLAASLSQKGLRVGILDADFGMANVDILFGINSRYSIYDMLYGDKTIEEIMVQTEGGIKVIPGGSGIRELADLDDSMRERLLLQFERFTDIDILLVDTGAGLSKNVLNFVEAADDVIIVTNSEPTALTDAYGLIKVILKNNIHNDIKVIINRVKGIKDARETFNKLSKTVEVFLNTIISYLGYISEDSHVGQAIREQTPFYNLYPKCEASLCIQKISSEIIGMESQGKSNSIKEYFNNLLKAMRR